MADDTRDRTGALSDRQKDILNRISRGQTHQEIGDALRLNKRSVTTMVTRSIIPKLGVYRTVQAVVMHAQLGDDRAGHHVGHGPLVESQLPADLRVRPALGYLAQYVFLPVAECAGSVSGVVGHGRPFNGGSPAP